MCLFAVADEGCERHRGRAEVSAVRANDISALYEVFLFCCWLVLWLMEERSDIEKILEKYGAAQKAVKSSGGRFKK